MSKFKVGDKVVYIRVVRGYLTSMEDGWFNVDCETFEQGDLYPAGTTIEIKEPKPRGGWVNLYLRKGVLSVGNLYATKDIALNKRAGILGPLGPPIYIEAKEEE